MVLAAGLLWSFQALIIRQMSEAGSWAVLFWRSLAMFPVLYLLVAWRSGGAPLQTIARSGAAGLVGGLSLVVAMGGAIVAFQSTTIANAAFLLAASPFLAAVLGWLLLRETVPTRTWVAVAIAVFGIFVMVRDGLAAGAWFGNLAAIASALGFAGFTVALRWRHIDDSLPCSLLGSLFSVIVGGLVAWQIGQPLLVPASDLAWCAVMGVVTLSGGMTLYTLGSKSVPSAELALLSNTEVMLAPFWVWLFMGETASAATLAGGAILLVAILFNAYSGVRKLAQA